MLEIIAMVIFFGIPLCGIVFLWILNHKKKNDRFKHLEQAVNLHV